MKPGVTSFKTDMALNDTRLLDVVPERKVDDPSNPGTSIAERRDGHVVSSLISQQQVNSLSTLHIAPHGEGEVDFAWTHFALPMTARK